LARVMDDVEVFGLLQSRYP